jgi:hypothetical protein
MRLRDITWRGSRSMQIKLLVLAWVLALLSLPAPAEDTRLIAWLFRAPVFVMIPDLFLSSFQPDFRSMAPVAISLVLFLLSPFSLLRQTSRSRNVAQRIASIGLLGVWAFPIVVEFFIAPRDRHLWGFQHVAWGWYLFATGPTIAFIAVQLGPLPPSKHDRRYGFPVVPLSGGSSSESIAKREGC